MHHKKDFVSIEHPGMGWHQLGFGFYYLSNWKLFKAWTRGIIFIFSGSRNFSLLLYCYSRNINLSYLSLLGGRKGWKNFMAIWRSYGETFIACLEIFEYFFCCLLFNRSRLNNGNDQTEGLKSPLFPFHYAFACSFNAMDWNQLS